MKHHLLWQLREIRMSLQCLMKNRAIGFILLCLLIVGRTYGSNFPRRTCLPGLDTPGWTTPSGDINVEVGKSLEIYCTLNDDYVYNREYTSGNIVFSNGSIPIDQNLVTAINETTAKLKIDNVTLQSMVSTFYCYISRKRYNDSLLANSIKSSPFSEFEKYTDKMVCANRVIVGSKPKDVVNFTCISYNWEFLNVSWTAPDNGVSTNYTVSYQIPKRGGRGSNYHCPNDEDIKSARCMWSMSTDPLYRKTLEYMTFNVHGVNRYGNSSQPFRIHHFAHILPNAPQELSKVSKTVSSVYLTWSIGHLHILEKKLVYKIEYTCNSNSTWNQVLFSNQDVENKGEQISVNVTGLEYPNTPYDFRVYSKSAVATGDQFWSKPSSVVVRTASCAPYKSPETDLGSFEIHREDNRRDVFVYWKALQQTEYNGDEFYYNISIFDEYGEVSIKPEMLTQSFAKYPNLSFNISYSFYIRSVNAEGPANYTTSVYVPKDADLVPEPTVFTKIDYGDGIYELSWTPPDNLQDKIVNYTTFWCESEKDRPYQCSGQLDWLHLPPNATKHNFTINSNRSYQFAISANTEISTSGMSWAVCTALHDKISKMKTVWSGEVGLDYFDIKWKLECSERIESIEGFNVYWCELPKAETNNKCIEPEKIWKIYGNVHSMHANITNLKPFTRYKVNVAIFAKGNRVGPPSEDMIRKTAEGYPETLGMKVHPGKVTNHSAVLEWQHPIVTNGHLQYYKVRYNENEITINATLTQITLVNLTSYTNYNVRVLACTAMCSPMDSIMLLTKVGIPGVVSKLTTEKINSSYVLVKWNKPLLLAGPSPIYDVRVQFDETDKNSTYKELETAQTKAEVPIPNCFNKGPRSSYTFYVRAKNIQLPDNTTSDPILYYYGDWSQAYTINCIQEEIPSLLQITIFIGLFILFVWGAIFFGKKGFAKFQQMQDFDVTLPPKFINPPLFHNDSKHQDYHINIGSWSDDNAECDHLNSKLTDLDQSSIDCIDMDMDLDTDRETDRSSSGCYTG
ncbi:cytokine receptor-like [Planococcus citri]|uniref:cytokine receptor-like n=1 Tax=Planococcus citri TaxID=170843 RepID=UPI0031F7DA43